MCMNCKSNEYHEGYKHAISQTEFMLITDVVHSISSFRFDPPDTDYQLGFLHGMEAYYKTVGRV